MKAWETHTHQAVPSPFIVGSPSTFPGFRVITAGLQRENRDRREESLAPELGGTVSQKHILGLEETLKHCWKFDGIFSSPHLVDLEKGGELEFEFHCQGNNPAVQVR